MDFGDIILTPAQEDHIFQAHQVTADELIEAFEDPDLCVQMIGSDDRPGKLYFGYARAGNGRLLLITFRWFPDGNIFVITARDMSDRDKRKYRRSGSHD